MSRRGRTPARAQARTTARTIASMFFMSMAPRPQTTPSRISPEKGCTLQSAGSAGTTSRWPWTSSASARRVGALDPGDHVRTPRRALQQRGLEAGLGEPLGHVLGGGPLLAVAAAAVGGVDADQLGGEGHHLVERLLRRWRCTSAILLLHGGRDDRRDRLEGTDRPRTWSGVVYATRRSPACAPRPGRRWRPPTRCSASNSSSTVNGPRRRRARAAPPARPPRLAAARMSAAVRAGVRQTAAYRET